MLKADTQPMPEHVPIEEKSPRIVALPLIKRARDIVWRQPARSQTRKPPSVALAAISLNAGPVQASLLDEVISIATAIRTKLTDKSSPRGTVLVLNPAYTPDVFTDRWPEDINAQNQYDNDLRRLIVQLHRLKNENLSLEEKRALLKELFGETAAGYAIESHLDAKRHEMEAGKLQVGPRGNVMSGLATAAAAAAAVSAPRTAAARPATREGGGKLSE
jgi:hypothetical protein